MTTKRPRKKPCKNQQVQFMTVTRPRERPNINRYSSWQQLDQEKDQTSTSTVHDNNWVYHAYHYPHQLRETIQQSPLWYPGHRLTNKSFQSWGKRMPSKKEPLPPSTSNCCSWGQRKHMIVQSSSSVEQVLLAHCVFFMLRLWWWKRYQISSAAYLGLHCMQLGIFCLHGIYIYL